MIEFDWHIRGRPEIQRDTTHFNNQSYIDGIWTRFYNQNPKKVGGYQFLAGGSNEIIRNIFEVSVPGGIDVFAGSASRLTVTFISIDGVAGVPRDRTPVGFTPNANFTWKFSLVVYNNIQYVLAIPLPNLQDINNMIPGTLYYGQTTTNLALTPVLDDGSVPIQATGGVTTIGNIIFVYGLNGLIRWNNGANITGPIASNIQAWESNNTTIIGSENIIYAAPIRNGSVYGGLFWAVQGVLKATFTQYTAAEGDLSSQPEFDFSYISYSSTILSSNCVVSYDPYFYWIGRDTFYIYNGTVSEIDNQTNKLFFFENLEQINSARVYGFFNTQFQEVWWGWANGETATENYQTWWDTANFNRSCGANTSSIFPYPILCDSSLFTPTNSYPLWQHEIGVDQVYNGNTFAIPAYIQTKFVENPNKFTLVADDLIFDIEQSQNMTIQVSKQGYPRSTPMLSDPVTFSPQDEHLTLREKGNFLSFIFQSNQVGGDYYFGDTFIKITGDEDERPGPVNE